MADENQPLAETPAATTVVNEPVIEDPKFHDLDNPPAETLDEPKPEAEAKPEETPEKPDVDDDGDDAGDKKKIPGSQRIKRKYELLAADHARTIEQAEQDRARAVQLEEALRRAHAGSQTQEGKPGVDREPKETDYPNDYLAYDEAKRLWQVRQVIRDETSRQQAEARRQQDAVRHDEFLRERRAAYVDNADVARERIPDFDKVMASAKNLTVKDEVERELLASDKPAVLAYHLAQNPDKVRELNALTGRELAREIGRLEARVHLPKAKTITTAPAPLTAPKGGAAPAFNPETASMAEFAARERELRKRR
jgi:hypothetical protein